MKRLQFQQAFKSWKKALLLPFLLVGFASNSQILPHADQILNQFGNQYENIGLGLLLVDADKTEFYSFGNLKEESGEPIDENSIFEIGSATKTFSGLMLSIAIEEKRINVGDFIEAYLPELNFPENLQNKIRITDLVSHQSGLPNLSSDKLFEELLSKNPSNPFQEVDQSYVLRVLSELKELDHPKKYQYNNFAFAVLAIILERVYDQEYESLVRDKIFNPLKMWSTTFQINPSTNQIGLYDEDGKSQNPIILAAVNAAGGIRSNAQDISNYLRAYLSSPTDTSLANSISRSKSTLFSNENKSIGYGWEISKDFIQKDGDTFGNSCLIRIDLHHQVGILIFSNHQNGQLVRDLMEAISGEL